MAKILGIGNCVLDIVLLTLKYPQEDSEIRATQKHLQAGGNVTNMLHILSQLKHETAICCTLGKDEPAKTLEKDLKSYNISVKFIQTFIQGKTPTSHIVLNKKNASRTIIHYRDLPEISFEHFAKIEIEDFDWLHFEARNMDNLPGMLNIAKTFLTYQPTSLEVEKDRPDIESLFPLVKVIFFSHHYAKQKGHSCAADLLNEVKILAPKSSLICTWGKKGAWFMSPNGEIQHQPAKKIPEVLDTLGAGDTFNAGVIHALIHGDSLKNAVKSGSDLAARKCQQFGFKNLLHPIKAKQSLANIRQITNAKTFIAKTDEHPFDIVLIKFEEKIKAYENNCPHQDVPLTDAYKIDVNPFEKTIKCSVHEAFFNIEDGECIEGPCINDYLVEVPIKIEDNGDIYLSKNLN